MASSLVERTKVAKAHSKFKSFKTTIPKSVVKQWGLDDSCELEWEWTVIDGKMLIIIKPIYTR